MKKALIIALFLLTVNVATAEYEVGGDGVYWDGTLVPAADMGSFEILSFPYYRDKDNMFYYNNVVEGANPDQFKLINSEYFNDNTSIYCRGKIINGADLETFTVLPQRYAKDKNKVYLECTEKWDYDAPTFEIIGGYYTKDKNAVYLDNIAINGSDPASFKILGSTNHGSYAHDKNYVYINGRVAENIVYAANADMYSRLNGRIILKVESLGEAYYLNHNFQTMHFLGHPDDAFQVMRYQGVGITNDDLNKIPIAIDHLTGQDIDNDGLPDSFEDAVGSDRTKSDSDGDGYGDRDEIANGYLPYSDSKYTPDLKYAKNQSGRILLQVDGHGEAWYVNPDDQKRYFLGRPQDAFNIMRNLGLGISNADFNLIGSQWNVYENQKLGIKFKYPPVNKSEETIDGLMFDWQPFEGEFMYLYEFRAMPADEAHINSLPKGEKLTLDRIANRESGTITERFAVAGYDAVRFDNPGICDGPQIVIFGGEYVYNFTKRCGGFDELNKIVDSIEFIK